VNPFLSFRGSFKSRGSRFRSSSWLRGIRVRAVEWGRTDTRPENASVKLERGTLGDCLLPSSAIVPYEYLFDVLTLRRSRERLTLELYVSIQFNPKWHFGSELKKHGQIREKTVSRAGET
jgi:hypothetical protein